MTFQPDYDPQEFEGAENLTPETEAEEALSERLRASTEDEQQHQRLKLVDSLLLSAPEVAPRPGFALRVMDLIRQRNREMRQHGGTGMILGLGMAATFSIGLLLLGALIFLGLLQTLVGGTQPAEIIAEVVVLLADMLASISNGIGSAPFIALITAAFAPMFVLWLWLMRRLLSEDGTTS